MLSMSSQTATQSTPLYVAELTESQAFVADIPPLVNIHLLRKTFESEANFNILVSLGTCSLQQRNSNNRWIFGGTRDI
jgi:hypothetical protein